MTFSFGTAQTPSLFGGATGTGGFGATATTASTGFGFGTPKPAATGFGGTPAPAFGTPATTAASTGFGGFGGFGTQPKTTASTGFGFGFGAPAASTAPSFGFGTTASTAAPSFGFGAPAATTSTGFGGFGAFGGTSTGFGGLSTVAQPQQQQQQQAQDPSADQLNRIAQAVSLPQIFGDERDAIIAKWNQIQALWGTGKGYCNRNQSVEFKPDNPFCRFKAVGYNLMPVGKNEDGLVSLIIKQPGQMVKSHQQQILDTIHKILGSKPQHTVCAEAINPQLDNKAHVIWGPGTVKQPGNMVKSHHQQILDTIHKILGSKPQHTVCAEAINPQLDNKAHVISGPGTVKQPGNMVKSHHQQILDTIHKILGSKPQHTVCAEAINPQLDNKTEVVVYVMERPQMGPAKRCPAPDLYNALNSPQMKQHLMTQLNVETITVKVLSKDQLKQYLDNPPAGVNPLLWQQAILDNPDPERLIPVPMIGFKELHNRLKCQDQQTKRHQERMDLIAQDLTEFQTKQSNMLAKLDEYKRRHLELSHRALQVIVKQEIHRKQGYAIQADEEQLRVQLEVIQAELNHPTQFKGRLNELMSQIRMQNHLSSSKADVNYTMDPSMQQEIKQLLKQQQEGLQHLIDIVKEDTMDLRLIEQGLSDVSASRR